MNKRERELAQRHLDELVRLRDNAWIGVHNGEGTKPMIKYEALVYAVKLAEKALR